MIPFSRIDQSCTELLQTMLSEKTRLGLGVETLPCGARVIDAGVEAAGSLEAGARLTELCQGGLGGVRIELRFMGETLLPHIFLETAAPKLAALALQSAMPFEGGMISGPLKLYLTEAAGAEKDLSALDAHGSLSAIVQADALPEDAWAEALARKAGCAPERLTLLVAPEASIAGSTQIAGRMNENIIFTMERSLKIDAACVSAITGFAPICPACAGGDGKKRLLPDDFLHYAAGAYLSVRAPKGLDAQKLARDLAFDSLHMDGVLFSDLLDAAGGDFFKIPNILHINKLATVTINELTSKRTYRAGTMRPGVLENELIS